MSSKDQAGRGKPADPPEFLVDEEFLEGTAPAGAAPEGTPPRRTAPKGGAAEGSAPDADEPPPSADTGFFADEEFLPGR
jgi:hypothetical protein